MNALLTVDLTDRLAALIAAADDTGDNTGGATAAGIGMPGLRSPDDAAALGAELTTRTGVPVRVTGDGETAWLGAFGAAPGIVVYAGTGSGGMGCDGERWARAGGHGFLLGDEEAPTGSAGRPLTPPCAGRTGWAARRRCGTRSSKRQEATWRR